MLEAQSRLEGGVQRPWNRVRAGFVVFLGIIVAAVLVGSWPFCLYELGALLAWAILRKIENPWAGAASAIFRSLALGLAPGLVILAIYGQAGEAAAAPVASYERQMLWLQEHLPDLAEHPWTIVGSLLLVTGLSFLLPRWKLVQRFGWLKDLAAQLAAAVTIATSFTFFTKTAVVDPSANASYARLQALYRKSEKKEARARAEELADESLARAVAALPEPTKSSYRQMLATVARWQPIQAQEMMADLAQSPEPDHAASAQWDKDGKWDQIPMPSKARIADALTAQQASEAAQEKKASDAEQGLEETLKETLGNGNDNIGHLVKYLVEPLLKPVIGELAEHVADYLGDVTAESIEKAQDGWRKEQVEKLLQRLEAPMAGKSGDTASLARTEIERLNTVALRIKDLTGGRETSPTPAHPDAGAPPAETFRSRAAAAPPGPDASAPSPNHRAPPPNASGETVDAKSSFENSHIQTDPRVALHTSAARAWKLTQTVEDLKGLRDRLGLLATHDSSSAPVASAPGHQPASPTDVSLAQVLAEARKQIAEANTAIESATKQLGEYQAEIELHRAEYHQHEVQQPETREPMREMPIREISPVHP